MRALELYGRRNVSAQALFQRVGGASRQVAGHGQRDEQGDAMRRRRRSAETAGEDVRARDAVRFALRSALAGNLG